MPSLPARTPKPAWLQFSLPGGERYLKVRAQVRDLHLHTVCEEAKCPNVGACWGAGTATLLILGDACTRACRFCAVKTANPRGALDPEEPRRVAEAVRELGLTYVVLTSVDRDDLPDFGAEHFAQTVRALHDASPGLRVEVLTPDFQGSPESVASLLSSRPEVVAHNIETVRRLTPLVRDRRAGYDQSLALLAETKRRNPAQITKSSIMLGLGETDEEVVETMRDLRGVGVDLLTLGQYLRPTPAQRPVERYVPPEGFESLRRTALSMGFAGVASGPLVRSSFQAADLWRAARDLLPP